MRAFLALTSEKFGAERHRCRRLNIREARDGMMMMGV